MKGRRKGQVEPITLVLLSGVIISLVGAAYFWGIPIIQKRTTIADFEAGVNFMFSLADSIESIAGSGGGRSTVDISRGFARVIPYDDAGPDNNSVILEVPVEQPMISLNQEIPIRSTSTDEVGVFGVNNPYIMTVKEEYSGTQYKLTFRLRFIELDTGEG